MGRKGSHIVRYPEADLDGLLSGSEAHADCLPQRQARSSPQGMTMTLLADYGLRTRVWIPSGAIVALLGEFGITAGGARAAISRLSRNGMLESSRRGRLTAYRLTPSAADHLTLGGAAVTGFPMAAESWDGLWTMIAFTMGDAGGVPRRALRNHLRSLGFAPLYDAVWVSPVALSEGAVEHFPGLDAGAITVLRAENVAVPTATRRDPLAAWDLKGVHQQYQAFIDHWTAFLPRLRGGKITGIEALHVRTEVMDTYRHFVSLDPMVPMRLMPDDWPRNWARQIFITLYDGLLEPALVHFGTTVAQFVDGPPDTVRGHTATDLLTGLPRSSPRSEASG
jgi:phenylacetic acid degradation operon negative regulatory protein